MPKQKHNVLRNISDWLWLVLFRVKVRMGFDPRRDKNGVRRQLAHVGLRKVTLSGERGNALLRAALEHKRFFVARIGYTEGRVIGVFRQYQLGMLRTFPDELRKEAANSSGIFTNDDGGLERFSDIFLESLRHVTHLALFSTDYEPLLAGNYAKKATLLHAIALEHFRYSPSWMSSLRDKKVLVVSLFAESIKEQYQKGDLFPRNPSANPVFKKLEAIKPDVTYGFVNHQHKTWEETLNSLYFRCLEADFDVAILSCGSYGLPLGAMLFAAGKNVIHVGGIAQIYFGIYGERYNNSFYNSFFTDKWIRPSTEEQFGGYKSIENGAYW